MLRKSSSVTDWGTFASNAVVSGNTNALRDTLDNYDSVKEFFKIENEAMIIAASMAYFGMDTVESVPTENKIPRKLEKASKEEQREWLHGHISNMLDKYVMDGVADIEKVREEMQNARNPQVLPCRNPVCTRTFVYPKCRVKHEKKIHDLEFVEMEVNHEESTKPSIKKKEDNVFNYGCLHLSLGLLLHNADDSVKEGDGERLMRVWKFLTFLYRSHGNHKYALAGLRLMASRLALLTPQKAHQLTWNRFANKQGGQGKCISRDLRLEHINQISKQAIRGIGAPNVSPESIQSVTQSTGPLEKLLVKSSQDLGLTKRQTHHTNKTRQEVFTTVLKQIHAKARMFNFVPGRKFDAFPQIKRNIYESLDKKKLHRWINKHKKSWHRQNRNYYRRDALSRSRVL